MGILNITPDSFSDGGRFLAPDQALAHAETMAAEGADIIDVGGESTRPYAESVPAQEEIQRIVPVIKRITRRIRIPVSVDTSKSTVAEAALDAGAAMINDISALSLDPELATVAARYQVPVVLMHMRGTPKNMQVAPVYKDLIGEIGLFLENAIQTAVKAGIPRSRLLIDPGIGFGKTVHHNLEIVQGLKAFQALNQPLVIGTSRKSFLRRLLQVNARQELDPAHPIVETGTQASIAVAVMNGAHIVRVHNVAETRATVAVVDAILQSAQPDAAATSGHR